MTGHNQKSKEDAGTRLKRERRRGKEIIIDRHCFEYRPWGNAAWLDRRNKERHGQGRGPTSNITSLTSKKGGMMKPTPESFKIGRRIYYTGDMANMSSFGTITAYRPRGQYTPESVDIKYDEERFEGDTAKFSRMVPVIAFGTSPGKRFWFLSEWNQHQAEELAKLRLNGVRLQGGHD